MKFKCFKCNYEWETDSEDKKYCQKCKSLGNLIKKNITIPDDNMEPLYSLTGMVNSKDFLDEEQYKNMTVIYTTDGKQSYNSYESEDNSMEIL